MTRHKNPSLWLSHVRHPSSNSYYLQRISPADTTGADFVPVGVPKTKNTTRFHKLTDQAMTQNCPPAAK
jgi:hypothetical protein